MAEEKFGIEVTGTGAKIAAEGGAAGRLGHSLADALSPFTNSLGAVGDVVRTFRQKNAVRSLVKARELAASKDINLSPVDPKFLVDWIEGSSLEEEGEDDLSEQWAGLLVSAAQGVSPNHFMFKRLLRDLSGRQAECLRLIFGTSDLEGLDKSVSDAHNKLKKLNEKGWPEFEVSLADEKFLKKTCSNLSVNGSWVVAAQIGSGKGPLNHMDSPGLLFSDPRFVLFNDNGTVSSLQALGLLERDDYVFKVGKSVGPIKIGQAEPLDLLGIVALRPSWLGLLFYWACQGGQLRK